MTFGAALPMHTLVVPLIVAVAAGSTVTLILNAVPTQLVPDNVVVGVTLVLVLEVRNGVAELRCDSLTYRVSITL